MLKHQLRASTTSFEHKRNNTWLGIGKWGGLHQIDCFLTSVSFPREIVLDAKRVGNGIDSDHAAIKLKLRINPNTKRLLKKRPTYEPKPNWSRFKENGKEANFRMKVDQALSECNAEIDMTTLNTAVMTAACETPCKSHLVSSLVNASPPELRRESLGAWSSRPLTMRHR
jgi:hypothetical protein